MADPRKTTCGGLGNAGRLPRGTRDFYPLEQALRRWVFDAWRRVSIRHGFDEIDGPTFEHLDLYTVKSGEGIVSELFSFRRSGGDTDFALRPEFTPTLARMVAARANSLPKPTRWFSVGSFFRAERPQRGRLREFAQWNVDMLGDPSVRAEAEVIACCVEVLRELGLTEKDVRVRVSDRRVVVEMLGVCGVGEGQVEDALRLLDAREKMGGEEFGAAARVLGLDVDAFDSLRKQAVKHFAEGTVAFGKTGSHTIDMSGMRALAIQLDAMGVAGWCGCDFSIVRGLAYYTGTVFEVHEAKGKERAIAGGGRYDHLVEMFGGPPTPAVGFAMGDVVLSLVLAEKGLLPEGAALLDGIGARPDVFVISNGEDESEAMLDATVAMLRREKLHARRTSRSTRNVGKLLKEAASCGSRFAVILESGREATVKNLQTGEETRGIELGGLIGALRR